ncbi:ATP-binding protein [Streptomyces sp. DH41]|uniref:ATP-binding protein n=1 Tax=Streptomyces sp. DH41 TaxID=3040125 RepID=UPI002442EE81|nr:ATP-binding protein [Streptomyces sp. DH41]MDG9722396.1 ATP-binding protein [Streptomyces sp. DH41]
MTTASTGVTPFTVTASFTIRFSATPRGARLARRLASHQLDRWGWPYRTPVHDSVELVVGELAANAVTHGRVPGRNAELRLAHDGAGRVLVEVSDVRGERVPVLAPGGRRLAEDGRGLTLVAALAEEWGGGRAVGRAWQDRVGRGDGRLPPPRLLSSEHGTAHQLQRLAELLLQLWRDDVLLDAPGGLPGA